jgi:hypothetical protein
VVLGALAAGSGREPALTRPLEGRLSGRERIGLAVGAGLALAADLVFLLAGESWAVRLLWAGAPLALLVLLWPARRTGGERKPWLLVALLTALAFALRYHDLTNLPADLDGDFASIGLEALGMMTAPVLKIVGVGWGELTEFYNRGVKGRDVSEEELRGDSLRPPFAVAIRPDRPDLAEMVVARHPDARRASIRGESSPNGYAVIAGQVDAPAYGTLGKTSAAGWGSGLLLTALVALRALRPRRRPTD